MAHTPLEPPASSKRKVPSPSAEQSAKSMPLVVEKHVVPSCTPFPRVLSSLDTADHQTANETGTIRACKTSSPNRAIGRRVKARAESQPSRKPARQARDVRLAGSSPVRTPSMSHETTSAQV